MAQETGSITGMKWAAGTLLIVSIFGASCQKAVQEPLSTEQRATATTKPVQTPEEKLYEQYRAGFTQLTAIQDDIEEALRLAQVALKITKGDNKTALEDSRDYIDSAGATLTEHLEDVPVFEDFKKNLKAYDDRRLKMIEAGNDAHHDLSEAQGILSTLIESNNPKVIERIEPLLDLVETLIEDIEDAILQMGGVVEEYDPEQ